jgi:hypothetical protein
VGAAERHGRARPRPFALCGGTGAKLSEGRSGDGSAPEEDATHDQCG